MRKIAIALSILLLSGCIDEEPKTPVNEVASSEVAPSVKIIPLVPAENIEVVEEEPVGDVVNEKPGIVHIKFKDVINDSVISYSVGTGFFVKYNNSKYLLTAGHNVGSSSKVSLFRNSGPIKTKILKHKVDQKHDLAIFSVETDEHCFELDDPKIFDNIPDYGQLYKPSNYKPIEVEMFGYPTEWHFRKIDGSIYQTIFNGRLLVSTGVCDSGMSGGPWFNKKTGKIVSVHAVQLMGTSSGGVPLSVIIKTLEEIGEEK